MPHPRRVGMMMMTDREKILSDQLIFERTRVASLEGRLRYWIDRADEYQRLYEEVVGKSVER